MNSQDDQSREIADQELVAPVPQPVEENIVSDDQLDKMAGGFDPQPDPPALLQERLLTQIGKLVNHK